MVLSTPDRKPRHTDLYAELVAQWARQTAAYSRSVRLYHEQVARRRATQRRVSGRAERPGPMLTRPSVRIVTLDAPNEGVRRPSAEPLAPAARGWAARTRDRSRCPLTARQLEIANLIAEGLTNGQIAARIVVSRGTVGNHIGHMLRRLGVSNRAQIAAWAIRHAAVEASGG